MRDLYTPNHIPQNERVTNILVSICLLLYGGYGIWVNDLYIPGKRSRGIHLHDVPAWVMYGAFICACLVMLSVVVDHYDKRNNEINYKRFADTFRVLGWCFFWLSLVLAIKV
jgi:TRAP-type C4-dicarboxylate transport system permease small subunit